MILAQAPCGPLDGRRLGKARDRRSRDHRASVPLGQTNPRPPSTTRPIRASPTRVPTYRPATLPAPIWTIERNLRFRRASVSRGRMRKRFTSESSTAVWPPLTGGDLWRTTGASRTGRGAPRSQTGRPPQTCRPRRTGDMMPLTARQPLPTCSGRPRSARRTSIAPARGLEASRNPIPGMLGCEGTACCVGCGEMKSWRPQGNLAQRDGSVP